MVEHADPREADVVLSPESVYCRAEYGGCLKQASLYFDAERRDATHCGHIDRPTRSINLATMYAIASLGGGSINGALGSAFSNVRWGRVHVFVLHVADSTSLFLHFMAF